MAVSHHQPIVAYIDFNGLLSRCNLSNSAKFKIIYEFLIARHACINSTATHQFMVQIYSFENFTNLLGISGN